MQEDTKPCGIPNGMDFLLKSSLQHSILYWKASVTVYFPRQKLQTNLLVNYVQNGLHTSV